MNAIEILTKQIDEGSFALYLTPQEWDEYIRLLPPISRMQLETFGNPSQEIDPKGGIEKEVLNFRNHPVFKKEPSA